MNPRICLFPAMLALGAWSTAHADSSPAPRATSDEFPAPVVESLLPAACRLEQNRQITGLEPQPVIKNLVPRPADQGAGDRIPNDPYYENQWGPACIDLERTWERSLGRRRARLAILDTGVDLDHPDLQANLVAGWDWVNGDADPDDDHGHGTAVAGVCAAVINNGVGIAGCVNEEIMPVKVINQHGMAYVSDVINGILWSIDNGADVILMPFTFRTAEPVLEAACQHAYDEGVLLFAAAGAFGTDDPVYPAAYTSVCGIAALMNDCQTAAYFNSFGFGNHEAEGNVEFVAPGAEVLTIVGEGYGYYSGTAVASGFAAAVGAGYFDAAPAASNQTIRRHMQRNADELGDPERYGYGRVDAAPWAD